MEPFNPQIGLLVDQGQEDLATVLQPFPEVSDCIRAGDLHALQVQLRRDWRAYYQAAIPDAGLYPVILPYLCGCCLTLALDGGLPLLRGTTLSTLYLAKARTVTTLDDFVDTFLQMLTAFTEEVCHYKRGHSGNRAVDQCLMYLYDHINEHISAEELARQCGYSVSHLQHLFRRYTGQSISCRIRQEKIAKACLLLKYSDESCLRIAQKLAYGSQSFFIQQFKREVGCTPAQYRAQNR